MQAPTQLQPPTCAVRITLSHAEAYTTIRTTHVCSTNHPKSCRGIRTQLQPPTCAVQTTQVMQRHTHTITTTHMCSANHQSHAEAYAHNYNHPRVQCKPPKPCRGIRTQLQPPTCAVQTTKAMQRHTHTIKTTHMCSANHPSHAGIRTQLQPPTCAVQTTKAMQRHTHTIKATHMCSTNHMSHAEARMQLKPPKLRRGMRVGLARTIYIQCIYGIFGREITKYTIIYGAYIQFWPTLHVCSQCPPGFAEHVCTQATQVIRGARAKPKLEVLQRMCALKATQVIRGVCETRA